MARRLEESVVAVTGASSGIGRASAVSLARRGATLALAARDRDALATVATECEREGATTLAMAVDVADEQGVEDFAAATVERFGHLDVWVNNAGVIAYGAFEEVPSEVFTRVLETNLFGQVHGARAALKRFRHQGSGVLINLSSVWGRVTTPGVAAYSVSKHAVRAFSECLRHELEGTGIEVATVLPQAVDTPIFDHAANYSGHGVRPIAPMIDPWAVADGIVQCAESPKREVTYGRAGRALEVVYALFPRLYCRIAPTAFTHGSFPRERAEATRGNLFEPRNEGARIEGGWRDGRRAGSRRALAAAIGGAVRGALGQKRSASAR